MRCAYGIALAQSIFKATSNNNRLFWARACVCVCAAQISSSPFLSSFIFAPFHYWRPFSTCACVCACWRIRTTRCVQTNECAQNELNESNLYVEYKFSKTTLKQSYNGTNTNLMSIAMWDLYNRFVRLCFNFDICWRMEHIWAEGIFRNGDLRKWHTHKSSKKNRDRELRV